MMFTLQIEKVLISLFTAGRPLPKTPTTQRLHPLRQQGVAALVPCKQATTPSDKRKGGSM